MGKAVGIALLSTGVFVFLVGLVLMFVALLAIKPQKELLFKNVKDLMHIDNTKETEYEGPLGDTTAEREQYLARKRSTQEGFDKCMSEDDRGKDDCNRGYQRVLTVYHVSNPEQVVLGQKANVEELGPIIFRVVSTTLDLDENLLDQDQILRARYNNTFEIDDECDSACVALLDREIVVPNPGWAGVLEQDGAEQMIVYSIIAGAAFLQATPTTYAMVGTNFGLSAGAESQAFMAAFATTNVAALQAAMGAFLQTTQVAAMQLQGGNTAATCKLKTYDLPAQKCLALASNFASKVQTHGVQALLLAYGASFGVGSAMPLFIKRKVREVVGYGIDTGFTDPILGSAVGTLNYPGGSYGKPGDFSEIYVGSNQGLLGFGQAKKVMDVEADCRLDPDCTLSNKDVFDSCTRSTTCVPKRFNGYYDNRFPGRVWGEPQGTDAAKPGSLLPVVYEGLILTLRVGDERTLKSKHDGDEFEIKYHPCTLETIPRNLENCAANGADSPGFDCDGPPNTVNQVYVKGVPVYASLPRFDHTQILDQASTNSGQTQVPYDASDRVDITPCSGTAWCDSKERNTFSVDFDPETGFWFRGHLPVQMSLRIGKRSSILFPNLQDALIPVVVVAKKSSPPSGVLKRISELQQAPDRIDFLWTALLVAGILALVCGLACGAGGAMVLNKKAVPAKTVDPPNKASPDDVEI